MKFLILSLGYHPDRIGGAFRYVREVAEGLAGRGHDVRVICPGSGDAPAKEEIRNGVHLIQYRNPRGHFFFNWLKENREVSNCVQRELTALNGDTLVVSAHAFFAPALRDIGDRTVCLFTGPWAQEYQFSRRTGNGAGESGSGTDRLVAFALRWCERYGLRRCRRVLTISEYYGRQLPLWHGEGLPPIEVVSGGVNLNQFNLVENRTELRRKHGIAPDQFVFLTVRRLEPRMGLAGLVDAYATVAPDFPRARLWVAGDGPEGEGLRQRAQSRGLTDRIRFWGTVAEGELVPMLNAADCVLMPSLDLEGLGLATLEALACGSAVLGSRAGATPELLEPLDPRLLFAPGDTEELVAALRRVLRDPSQLPSRSRCREYVAANFTWSRPVEALERAYARWQG